MKRSRWQRFRRLLALAHQFDCPGRLSGMPCHLDWGHGGLHQRPAVRGTWAWHDSDHHAQFVKDQSEAQP